MSLIVYDGDTLYADRFIRIHEFADVFRIEEGPKLWVKSRFITMAILGPQPHEADMADALYCIGATIYLLEATGELLFFDNGFEDIRERAWPSKNTTWFVLTNERLYKMESDKLYTLSNDIEYCDGSGQTFYTVARQAGLSVLEAYQEVCQIERTVGASVDYHSRSKLDSIKEYYSRPENQERLQKLMIDKKGVM